MDNTNAATNLKADLTKELAIVKALIAQHGVPQLTEAVLKAAEKAGRS